MTDAEAPRALELLLEDLAKKCVWLAELEDERAKAIDERADLQAAIQPLLRGLPQEERRLTEMRIAGMTMRHRQSGANLGQNGVSRAALAFLAESEAETIRAIELTWYLRRMGYAPKSSYAPTLLRDWAKRGVVSREGHGIYRINQVHPALLKHRLAGIRRQAKRL